MYVFIYLILIKKIILKNFIKLFDFKVLLLYLIIRVHDSIFIYSFIYYGFLIINF